jgi:hypothetical protein
MPMQPRTLDSNIRGKGEEMQYVGASTFTT